jgi:hypothetical protein
MRAVAERREDGVYVVAGVELIEPVQWFKRPQDLRPDEPMRPLKIGDEVRYELRQRLRAVFPTSPAVSRRGECRSF